MDCENLYRVTCMLLTDSLPRNLDTIFFHARAHGDSDQLFGLAADYYRRYNSPCVFINGGDGSHRSGIVPHESWAGAKGWAHELIAFGISSGDIVFTKSAFNTKEENDYFLELARERKLKRALVVGQPHHLVRSFLGLLKSMSDANYWMRIYAVSPKFKTTDSWWQAVYSFSAFLTPEELPLSEERYRPRFDLVGGEVTRIPRYQEKGDLATFEELFLYLRRRENII